MLIRLPRLLPLVILVVLAMALVIAVIVGWSIILPLYYAASAPAHGAGLWIIMGLGEAFLALVLVALALFLAALIRRHRLLHRQDTFIDTVTHELRTPLTGLRLGVETLERRRLTPEAQGEFLHRMHGDLERLQSFIDHLIEAGRLAHGERSVTRERVDLAGCLALCRDRITLRFDLVDGWCQLPTTAPAVAIDRTALETIVLNLFDNAVKYANGTPAVSVGITIDDGRLRLTVTDRGIGFAPRQQKRLFHRFARLPGRHAGVPGTGLGLFVLAELCHRLGGEVSAHSDGPDTGATFRVILPVDPAPETAHA